MAQREKVKQFYRWSYGSALVLLSLNTTAWGCASYFVFPLAYSKVCFFTSHQTSLYTNTCKIHICLGAWIEQVNILLVLVWLEPKSSAPYATRHRSSISLTLAQTHAPLWVSVWTLMVLSDTGRFSPYTNRLRLGKWNLSTLFRGCEDAGLGPFQDCQHILRAQRSGWTHKGHFQKWWHWAPVCSLKASYRLLVCLKRDTVKDLKPCFLTELSLTARAHLLICYVCLLFLFCHHCSTLRFVVKCITNKMYYYYYYDNTLVSTSLSHLCCLVQWVFLLETSEEQCSAQGPISTEHVTEKPHQVQISNLRPSYSGAWMQATKSPLNPMTNSG